MFRGGGRLQKSAPKSEVAQPSGQKVAGEQERLVFFVRPGFGPAFQLPGQLEGQGLQGGARFRGRGESEQMDGGDAAIAVENQGGKAIGQGIGAGERLVVGREGEVRG